MWKRGERGDEKEKVTKKVNDWIAKGDTDAPLNLTSLGLESLPELPHNVKILYCGNNALRWMFSPLSIRFPKTLRVLECSYNRLQELPPLPKNLVELHCQGNQLTELPELSDSIMRLTFGNRNFTSLPKLPDSCIQLECIGTELTSLPPLPHNLKELTCYQNRLTSLPELPNSLIFLNCEENNLPEVFYRNEDEQNADEDEGLMKQYINRIRPLIKKRSNLQKNLKYHITNPKREKFAMNLGTHKNNPLHRFAMKNIANFMDEKNLKNINTNSMKPSNVEFTANKNAARRRLATRKKKFYK